MGKIFNNFYLKSKTILHYYTIFIKLQFMPAFCDVFLSYILNILLTNVKLFRKNKLIFELELPYEYFIHFPT